MTSLKLVFFLFLSLILISCSNNSKESEYNWPIIKVENKPGVYWWWMGSAVDKENITYNLKNLSDAGIGGVLVIPIYGVQGEENKYIDFLSPKWIDMLGYTSTEAKRLNLNVDMTTGTGWPFGGSHITKKDAALKIRYEKYSLQKGESVHIKIDPDTIQSLRAFSDNHKSIDLLKLINIDNEIFWKATNDDWQIFKVWTEGTQQKVKRAAPGNEGLVLDPFSSQSMLFYLERFNQAFKTYNAPLIRAQYHDSYEYYNATWTNNFFPDFLNINGYNLQDYLPELFSQKDSDIVKRIKADYRNTLSELHHQYIKTWVSWAHNHKWITRNEAHGAPANILDNYSLSDIPETEIFGTTFFNIPGLRQNSTNIEESIFKPLILKFSSSAAHVSGKRLISSETCTWQHDHYMVSLAQIKPELDQLFLAGINHIYYHGNAYSPKNAVWPGWLFYASTHFEPENTIWQDFPELNKYVTRCQSILQNGLPSNDILLYWPIQDIWHSFTDLQIKVLNVHTIDWFTNFPISKIANNLKNRGYDFDYISDKQIMNLKVKNNALLSHNVTFKTIVVPECNYIPLKTWKQLYLLAEKGATIIFHNKLPKSIPGFSNFNTKQNQFFESLKNLSFIKSDSIDYIKIGQGKFLVTPHLEKALKNTNVNNESLINYGIQSIKRKRKNDMGYDYFIANLNNKKVNNWITLAVSYDAVIFFDPLTGNKGAAKTRINEQKKEIYLQLDPGESLIIRTYNESPKIIPSWKYRGIFKDDIIVKGPWKIEFLTGGPSLPKSIMVDTTILWSDLNIEEYDNFSGTAKYTTTFSIDKKEKNYLYELDLGLIYESAKIKLNGQDAGSLWSIPFKKNIGKYLKSGTNKIEIIVTNLAANRISYLDRNKIIWRKFFFVNINYKKYDTSNREIIDSGIIGPVRILKSTII